MKSTTLAIVLTVLLIPATAGLAAEKDLGPTNPVSIFLEDCLVGPGREYRTLALFPILLDGEKREFSATTLAAAAKDNAIEVSETKPAGPPSSVRAHGFGKETVLVLLGDVLVGGRLDRMIKRDAAVRSKKAIQIPAVGVEEPSSKREKRVTFDANGLMAPPYLRMATHRGDFRRSFERFLKHYENVLPRDEKENPKGPRSLDAIMGSDRMRFLVSDYEMEFKRFPRDIGGPVIGIVGLVGDRILLFEAFGSPEAFQAHWLKILGSLAFAAAGHEIRTGVAGQPFLVRPAEGVERYLTRVSSFRRDLAGAPVHHRKDKSLAAWYRIAHRTVVGGASTGPDGVIHLAAFPLRASDDALYGKRLPPEEVSTETPDVGELVRREKEGRLTEYEKRWLERLRERRRKTGGPDIPDNTGPDGLGTRPGPGTGQRPVKPGDVPKTDKPTPPKPGDKIKPPSGGLPRRDDPIPPTPRGK